MVKWCPSTASPKTSLRQARFRLAVRGAAVFPSNFRAKASRARRTVAGSSSAETGMECLAIQRRAWAMSSGGVWFHRLRLYAHPYSARRSSAASGIPAFVFTRAGVIVANASA